MKITSLSVAATLATQTQAQPFTKLHASESDSNVNATGNSPDYKLSDCAGFVQLGFKFSNFAEYGTNFNKLSLVSIAQTGVYTGVDKIKEYYVQKVEAVVVF